jgi:hypothetical protein
MNRIINCMVLIGFSVCGAQAFADDSVSRATPTDHQTMKDCIEKQKANDVTMSKSEMTRICKDQMKQQKKSGTPIDAPPTDTPHN